MAVQEEDFLMKPKWHHFLLCSSILCDCEGLRAEWDDEVWHLFCERHRAAADRMALQVLMTVLSGANAKSTSTAVTINVLPRLSTL